MYVVAIIGAPQKQGTEPSIVALDFFHHTHGSSPLGRALSVLISILTKASSIADAAVDASTPDDEEKDAEELVCNALRYPNTETEWIKYCPYRSQILKRQSKMPKRSKRKKMMMTTTTRQQL